LCVLSHREGLSVLPFFLTKEAGGGSIKKAWREKDVI